MDTYSPVSKCSSALTRLAKLVSPFQGCLEAGLPRGLLGRRWYPTLASQPPRHDQYEISGLKHFKKLFTCPLIDDFSIGKKNHLIGAFFGKVEFMSNQNHRNTRSTQCGNEFENL